MYVYSLYKAMAGDGNHRYTSLTDLLDPAQKKAHPVVLDHDDDHSNYGHGPSDGDDRYCFIISNNSSSVVDLSKPPLASPTAAAAALSPLHDEEDHDDNEVEKKLSGNNNCSMYDESAAKLLFPAPIFSCLKRNKGTAAVGCPCVYRELDELGKTSFIPETVFLPQDITAASSSSDHHEKGKKELQAEEEGDII